MVHKNQQTGQTLGASPVLPPSLSLTLEKGLKNSVILPSTLLAWELECLLLVLTWFTGTQGFQVMVNVALLFRVLG